MSRTQNKLGKSGEIAPAALGANLMEFYKFLGGPADGEIQASESGLPASNIRLPDSKSKNSYSVYLFNRTECAKGETFHVLTHHSDVATKEEAERIASEGRFRPEYRKAWEDWTLRPK
jgi:hypothetical protein